MLSFTSLPTASPALATAAAIQTALPDTVAMAPVRDAFDVLQAGVLVLIVVGLVLSLLFLVRILAAIRKLSRSVDPLVEKAETGIGPVLDRARSVAENVDYVSHAVRTDVEGLTRAIERIRARLDQASDHMEERIEEFNALLEVVQDEAEEIFLDTASTVRGVRQGSKTLSRQRRKDGPDGSGTPEDSGSRSGSGVPEDVDDLSGSGAPESEPRTG